MKPRYNELVRYYNRNCIKLRRLIAAGKNLRKQTILRKRIAKLFDFLSGVKVVRIGMPATVFASMFVIQTPNVNAQAFGPMQTDPFVLTHVGGGNSPTFADLDGDGDMDLMMAEYFDHFQYYENIGSPTSPVFTTGQADPFGLLGEDFNRTLRFADLDNDGDMDVIGGKWYGGDFTYYENTGTSASANFASAQINPFGLSSGISGYFQISIVDLDDDGDLDLMMAGYNTSGFQYFENTGNNLAPSFATAQTNPFGLSTVGLSQFDFADLDNDGDFDLMTLSTDYAFRYYENVGTSSAAVFGAPQTNPFGLVDPNVSYGLEFVDLDSDGDEDLMSFFYYGEFKYFENISPTGLDERKLSMSIYPTVVSDVVNLEAGNTDGMTISVLDMLGREVLTEAFQATKHKLDFTSVAPGVYMVQIEDKSGNSTSRKVMKF